MKPNPNNGRLQDANRRAQSRDDAALDDANVSKSDARNAVDDIDAIVGVKMAFRIDESAKIHARVDGVGAICGIKAAGYTVEKRDRDADGTLAAIVDLSEDGDTDGQTVTCPVCGSADVKDGAAANPDKVFDFGCRKCGALWNRDD